jgi:hypothetical protein
MDDYCMGPKPVSIDDSESSKTQNNLLNASN